MILSVNELAIVEREVILVCHTDETRISAEIPWTNIKKCLCSSHLASALLRQENAVTLAIFAKKTR